MLSLYCSRGLSWVHMCECCHTLPHSTARKGDSHDYKYIIEMRRFNIVTLVKASIAFTIAHLGFTCDSEICTSMQHTFS